MLTGLTVMFSKKYVDLTRREYLTLKKTLADAESACAAAKAYLIELEERKHMSIWRNVWNSWRRKRSK